MRSPDKMKIKKTFISSKYMSMLCSGTLLMVLTAIMSMVDTLIAGITLGEDAVAGICLVLPVYSLASFFAVCFSYGVPILYAGKIGSFRKKEADKCFGVGLTVVSVIGILMFFLILLCGDAFLRAYNPEPQVYESASEYLSWMKFVVLLLPLNELLDGMLFADGDEKISLTANISQGVLKVILSVVLCRIMGVSGLAVASLISFAVSILISFIHFFRPGNTLKLNLAFSPAVFRDIIRFGLVDASTHLFISLFTVVINFFVITVFGPEMLIIVSVITLLKEGQILFEGIGEAITPLISTYLGEGNYPGIRKIWMFAQWSLWAESFLSTVFILVFAPSIVGLLGISDPSVAGYAIFGLRIMSLTLLFTCRLFLDSSYFILVERVSLGVLDSLLRDLVPALPLAVLGGLTGGIYGMFIGLAVAPPIGFFLSVLYIKKKYGKENYALFLADMEKRKNVKLYEFKVSPDAIIKARDEIGILLKDSSCSDKQINRTMLIFEELFMLIHDCNPGKTILAECLVEIGDTIRLTTKDNGRIIDLTDTDRDVSSLRSYVFSSLLETHTTRRIHFLALSYNHTVLEIN